MTDPGRKYYSDIVQAIHLIEEFTVEVKTFEQYCSDLKTKSAVERQLVILGEAMNMLRKTDPLIVEHAQQITSFRNRLVHAYDSIDDSIVWLIIQRYLAPLKAEVEQKLC